MTILIYFLFFLMAFLLGFFGLAPIIVSNLLSDKMPYIILVILGYITLIVLFVLWQNGYPRKLQNKEKNLENDKDENDLDIQEKPEELDESEETEEIEKEEESVKTYENKKIRKKKRKRKKRKRNKRRKTRRKT